MARLMARSTVATSPACLAADVARSTDRLRRATADEGCAGDRTGSRMERDMQIDTRQLDTWHLELARARRRRDTAANGSPDWDAASEAVLELESYESATTEDPPRRALYLVGPRSAG